MNADHSAPQAARQDPALPVTPAPRDAKLRRNAAPKRWAWVVIAAALGLGAVALLRPKPPTLPNVNVVKVETGEFIKTVSSSGPVKANVSRTLSFPGVGSANGVPNVREVAVKQGDTVQAGQYLARQDAESLGRDVQAARSSVRSAENDLRRAELGHAEARRDLQRQIENARTAQVSAQVAFNEAQRAFTVQRDLLGAGVASEQDVRSAANVRDEAQRKLEVAQRDLRFSLAKTDSSAQSILAAQAALDSSRVRWQNLEKSLSDTKLYAPVSGVVTGLNITVGTPPPNNQPAIEITDPTQLYVDIQFDETRAADLRVGQSASVKFDALPRRTFAAVVSRVSPVARETGQVAAVQVRVKLLDTRGVRPGFTGTATVTTKRLERALSVPLEALQDVGGAGQQNAAGVWRVKPEAGSAHPSKGQLEQVKVQVQERNANVAALSGLRPGDLIMSPALPDVAHAGSSVTYEQGAPDHAPEAKDNTP